MVKLDEAIESARLVFREYLTGRHVPDEIVARLSVGAHRDGVDWIVTVVLMSGDPTAGEQGLAADLIGPRPELVAAIRVDGQTGHAAIEEWALPIWQLHPQDDSQVRE